MKLVELERVMANRNCLPGVLPELVSVCDPNVPIPPPGGFVIVGPTGAIMKVESSFRIVPLAVLGLVTVPPPVALDSVTVKVSLGSSVVSPLTLMVTVVVCDVAVAFPVKLA